MSRIRRLTDRILEDKVVTRGEYEELMQALYEDGKIDLAEKNQIERICKLVDQGEVTLED